MTLTISGFLKESVGKVLAEMISKKETSASTSISGFPLVKVSLNRPASGTFSVMHGSDFPGIEGLEEKQKIYVFYQGT